MSTFIYPPVPVSITPSGTEATAANQVLEIAELQDINSELDSQTTLLTTIAGDTTSLDTKVIKSDTDDVTVTSSVLPTGAATETTLSALNTKVTTVDTDDVTITSSALPTGAATETTLSALNTKVTTVDTDDVTITSSVLPTGAATETTLSALNTKVTVVDTDDVTITSSALPAGAATEATLSSLNAKVTAVNTGAVTISTSLPAGNNNIGDVDVASLPGTVSTDIESLNAKLSGSLVPEEFDEIALTYIGATDRIDTAIYKLATVTVKTLTLSYDGSNRLSGVVAS